MQLGQVMMQCIDHMDIMQDHTDIAHAVAIIAMQCKEYLVHTSIREAI